MKSNLILRNTLKPATTRCNSIRYRIRQRRWQLWNTLQHAATRCNTLQHDADHFDIDSDSVVGDYETHCNTLQHAATRCNSLQLTSLSNPIASLATMKHIHIFTYIWICITHTCGDLWYIIVGDFETYTYLHVHMDVYYTYIWIRIRHRRWRYTQNTGVHTATRCNSLQHPATHWCREIKSKYCNILNLVVFEATTAIANSFAAYRLFHRALLQKRPIFVRSLLIVANP